MKIKVKAKPSSRSQYVKKTKDGEYEVAVKQPPVNGSANRAIISAVAEYFKVKAFQVRITNGYMSQNKILEITNAR